ncbi:hypothetical protein GWC77_27940 [Paraburkholderia sp. NMBU_R16]|uniref:hypothetical protein n=1 Tax=Paraburkholderia sp. NMBU_R16 TaxID=2698676 RepID=UPI00156660B3|nr:hypothetical protein [Paraburkholderia sp. NMBU_R16]NRO99678.1 hypothetical protein [Paraburkholderia sp. NMBU_R16]
MFERSLAAILAATAIEYPLTADAQLRVKDEHGNLAMLQGAGMAIDQAVALSAMYALNKWRGGPLPSAAQIAGYGLSGLGCVIQSGALNGLVNRAMGSIDGKLRRSSTQEQTYGELNVDDLRERRRRVLYPEPATGQDVNHVALELGFGPVAIKSPKEAALQKVMGGVPDEKLDQWSTELKGTIDLLSEFHRAIFHSTNEPGGADRSWRQAASASTDEIQIGKFMALLKMQWVTQLTRHAG